MIKFKYTVKDHLGIHARPAGEIALLSKKFDSLVTFEVKGKEINAKKLLVLLGSGLECGDEFTVVIDGIDELECSKALKAKIKKVL